MFDFLTRLAERTLRTVPAAQPVLASRFAPGQVMPAPILETETWSTAGTAPMQDAASAFRAEAGSVTTTQSKPDDHASLHLEQDAMVEANSVAGDRVGTNQPEMNRPRTGTISTSPILLTNDAKSVVRRGAPPPNEMPAAASIIAGDLQERTDQTAVGGIGAIHRPLLPIEEDVNPNTGVNLVAGRPGLSVRQQGFPALAEEVGKPDSIEAQFIVPSVPSPQPLVTNQLPTGQLPEEADTPEMATKELISAPQARTLRLAPASGMTSQRDEPVALEQEETISPQSVAERNSIVPLTPTEQLGMSLKRDAPLNLLIEETFDSIVASQSQSVSPINTTASHIHPGKEVTNQEQFNAASARNHGDRNESPLLLAARETYIVGAPAMGALPRSAGALPSGEPAPALHDQGRAVPLTGDQKSNKATPSRPQPPSPLRTIGQVDVLSVEQHLLVSQVQLSQGTAAQEQADGTLINVFPSRSVRNLSRAPLSQRDTPDLQSGSAMASATEAPATPPSIHITIGRIDVRAVTSSGPTPSPKPARPSPLLPLDDYLKQGKGGR